MVWWTVLYEFYACIKFHNLSCSERILKSYSVSWVALWHSGRAHLWHPAKLRSTSTNVLNNNKKYGDVLWLGR